MTRPTATDAAPPPWADALLRLVVRREDFASLAGDLLEEYRDRVRPARGPAGADRWYVAQVLGFVRRAVGPWAALFAGAFLARTATDWLAPPADFTLRAGVTTYLALGLLVGAGAAAAWRAGAIRAGVFAGAATAALAAPLSLAGAALLLAVRHDPETLAAIAGSGGLGEVFALPLMAIVPGVLAGAAGGTAGAAARRLRAA
jgi:hypothetical protein